MSSFLLTHQRFPHSWRRRRSNRGGLSLGIAEIGGCKGDYSTGAVIIERHHCQIAVRRETERNTPSSLFFPHRMGRVEKGFGADIKQHTWSPELISKHRPHPVFNLNNNWFKCSFSACTMFLCAFFIVLDIDLLLKFYVNLGSLRQILIVVLCGSSTQGLVRDWDLFAPKISGPNLSWFCIFYHAFLWSTGILWYPLACVTDVHVYSSSSS